MTTAPIVTIARPPPRRSSRSARLSPAPFRNLTFLREEELHFLSLPLCQPCHSCQPIVRCVRSSRLAQAPFEFLLPQGNPSVPFPRQPPSSPFPPRALFCPVGSNSRTRPADVPPGSASPSHERRPLLHPPRGQRTARTPAERPFRRFDAKCLKCGSYGLRLACSFDEPAGEVRLVVSCSRCRQTESLELR